MYTFIIIIVILAGLAILLRVAFIFSDNLKFYTTGLDSGFKFSEITLLWKLSKAANIEEPCSLFWSVPALNRSIAMILDNSKKNGTESDAKTQAFLSKLYQYRTRVELEPDNKHKLSSTKLLDTGQKLRIILKGFGVFYSSILNSGRELIISIPVQNGKIILSGTDWIGKSVSVYLWRKDDAGYVFDTIVVNATLFNGRNALNLEHTSNMIRTQKRKSVRCSCAIYAQMYFIKSETQGYTAVESDPGYKCLIEDISEDGALIRIGGQGRANIQMKLQFQLNDKTVVMFGVIKAVEYNQEKNQSRLHFECIRIENQDKNTILSYVYNLVPQEQKEILDAMRLSEEDHISSENQSTEEPTIESDDQNHTDQFNGEI